MNRRRNKQRGRSIFGPRAAELWIWDGPLEAAGGVGGVTSVSGFQRCCTARQGVASARDALVLNPTCAAGCSSA